jgi:hypothetical protein
MGRQTPIRLYCVYLYRSAMSCSSRSLTWGRSISNLSKTLPMCLQMLQWSSTWAVASDISSLPTLDYYLVRQVVIGSTGEYISPASFQLPQLHSQGRCSLLGSRGFVVRYHNLLLYPCPPGLVERQHVYWPTNLLLIPYRHAQPGVQLHTT